MNLELEQIAMLFIVLLAIFIPLGKIYFDAGKDIQYLKELHSKKNGAKN